MTAMTRAAAALLTLPLLLTGCGGPSRLETAAQDCKAGSTVADSGRTISMKVGSDAEKAQFPIETANCILNKLGAPQAVVDHFGSTRAIDGQQTDEWDGVKARFSYGGPSKGGQLILTDSK